jgi:glucosamine--fructose-6-phosphate aminotransferase (isomerizing)
MLKEIAQTPSTITAAASNFCDNAKAGDIKNMVASAKGILLVGCGTAYNSGLVAQGWLKHRGIGCEVQVADQVTADDLRIWGSEGKLVFAISQSGETADTVEVARQLKEGGAKVVAITNVAYSALTRIADWVVDVSAGSEICVAATKSYAGQLACLYMLFGWAGEPNNLKSQLLSCAEGANKVFERRDELDTMARLCAGSGAVFFLGKGQDYAVATEGSLKLKEVSYIFSDAYPAGELKHGTLALIDGNTLSVIIICNKEGAEGCIAATEQILSRGGKTAVITSLPEVYERLKGVVEVFLLPPCPTHLTPFLSATALQLLAYKTALLKGTNPDKPRNLAKSVTV